MFENGEPILIIGKSANNNYVGKAKVDGPVVKNGTRLQVYYKTDDPNYPRAYAYSEDVISLSEKNKAFFLKYMTEEAWDLMERGYLVAYVRPTDLLREQITRELIDERLAEVVKDIKKKQ